MRRSKPLGRGKSKPKTTGPLTAGEWREECFRRGSGRSAISGEPAEQVHHVVPAQRLKRDGKWDVLYDPDNGMLVTKREHERHELAVERIPRSALPAAAEAFAIEHGFTTYLERTYP